jgi:GNAT superfamily N-acetyltransferase
MSELTGDGFTLRRARDQDIPWLLELARRPDVADVLAFVSPWAEERVRAALAADPVDEGRFVLEVDGARAGALAFALANRRSRIAYLFGVMVDPAWRGRGLGPAAAACSPSISCASSATTACSSRSMASTSPPSAPSSGPASCAREPADARTGGTAGGTMACSLASWRRTCALVRAGPLRARATDPLHRPDRKEAARYPEARRAPY